MHCYNFWNLLLKETADITLPSQKSRARSEIELNKAQARCTCHRCWTDLGVSGLGVAGRCVVL